MKKTMGIRSGLLSAAFLLLGLPVGAQRVCVVADAVTHEPVVRASLYTKEGGQFHSAVTNEQGRCTIGFAYSRLTVSHLNYEKCVVRSLGDTLFLTPRYWQKPEVVVRNVEPAWIRPLLKRIAREKNSRYFGSQDTLQYSYSTQSIAGQTYYRYDAEGCLRTRTSKDDYAVSQTKGIITALDTTRLTDMANLRRMLYEDFVLQMDGDFIRSHRFGENPEYKGSSPSEVELIFRSKHHHDDRGRIVVDTVRCLVLSATRVVGTSTNRRMHMSPLLLGWANVLTGYKVLAWNTDYRVVYADIAGQMRPAEVRYKFYMKTHENSSDPEEEKYYEQTGGGFANMEATLRLAPSPSPPEAGFLPLPGSWYLRLSSETERQQEIALAHMPADFRIYEEQP